jgi:hypothetical protein
VFRSLLIAVLVLALAPVGASAAVVDELRVTPKGGVDFGESHTVTGRVTGAYGAPAVAVHVQLEARAYPYKKPFAAVEQATTGLDGRFAFDHAFDRNQQLRVVATDTFDRSVVKPAYVFPRTNLTFGLVRRNVIRIVQTYRTPKNIKLTAPTLFYVGKAGKKTAPLAAKVKTKPVKKKGKVRKGRFRASAQVRIPKAWKGRFRYASCFPYNAGMGNPKLGCPKKKYKF